MAHPVLPKDPTLPQIQLYIDQMVKHRGLNNSNAHYELMLLIEEVGELAKAIRKATGGKFAADTSRTNLDHEAADVFMMLIGICNIFKIDLEKALRDKEEINKLRKWEFKDENNCNQSPNKES